LVDLLCISKGSLEDHLEKLEEVLRQLCDVGLKVNDEKLIFCALEIEYLQYILTRDGIKPQSNKVQEKYETLFDGTLFDWKTKPVSFQLKEGVSPYHGRAFPVPKLHKDTIIKEVEQLCKLGVLVRQPASEWALPSFITTEQ
jgi:hypothetical protein